MNKQQFPDRLQNELRGLPKKELNDRPAFYEEIIDDRAEEGLTEEKAVAELGEIAQIVAQILEEIPLSKLVHNQIKIPFDRTNRSKGIFYL